MHRNHQWNYIILSDLMRESSQLRLQPVVLFGSLLGIVRNGELLAWNNDVELGVLSESWENGDLESLIKALRACGHIVNHYKLTRAISVRGANGLGEIHLNCFFQAARYCYRPIEPANFKYCNIFSACLYFLALLISAELDRKNTSAVKRLFSITNKLIPAKLRVCIARMLLWLSLFFTSWKGVNQFPFSLDEPMECDLRKVTVLTPKDRIKVVSAIYGADWATPKEGWSFYDPANHSETAVKRLAIPWDYASWSCKI